MSPLSRHVLWSILLFIVAAGSTALAGDQAYPIVVEHAFGTTTIKSAPKRVATVAWANQEVPLALGVVPVGMAKANFGDDDNDGMLPWVASRLKELGGNPPVLFDEGDGIDFEAVAATEPDVILAAYSGLSRADYDTLSQIAPVIAYPQSPWATDWRDMIRLNSAGLGLKAKGDALIETIEADIAKALRAFPDLKGKTAMFVTHLDTTNLSVVNFYTANDARVKFFEDLGLKSPKSVVEATKPGQFSGAVSAERVDAFDDVDILVTYGGQDLLDALKADPLLSKMPAVQHNAVVMLGRNPVGTAANPTPLSISWVLKDYLTLLDKAAKASEPTP